MIYTSFLTICVRQLRQPVFSQAAERRKTWDLRKLGKIWKTYRLYKNNCLVPILPPKIKVLSILAQNPRKIEIELFLLWTISSEMQRVLVWTPPKHLQT